MRSQLRSVTTAAVLVLLVTTSLSTVCAGWQGSAQARMACCKGANHHCDSSAADDCCAGHEDQGQSRAALGAVVLPDIAASTFVPAPPLISASSHPIDRVFQPPVDTYLLLSVFLI